MPEFPKASKLIALSAFALSVTLFHATTMRAATTAADTATAVSTSADATAATADAAAAEPQAAPAAAPAAAPTWSVGSINFSGLVDGYYNFNANHPTYANYGDGDYPYGNQLRTFDTTSNGFALSMVKLSMSSAPAPVGFQVDLMFGPSGDDNFDDYIEQAYVSWKPTNGHGFEADFGQFVTSAGAEVIESMNNPNYSRSLLFQYLIPLYHVGLRTTLPVTKSDTVGFQLVNGWNGNDNSIYGDNNAGKTIGLTNLYTKTNFNWALNYYFGPENYGTDKGYRNLIDTTLNLTPASMPKVTGYINYDYVQNRNADTNDGYNYFTTNLVHEQGIAVEGRYQATGNVAFSGRYEYVADQSGQITQSQIGGTVVKASLNEFTITGEYKMSQGLLARLEYRRDGADNAIFVKGANTFNPSNLVKAQSTLELGIVAFFGPAH